MPNATSAVPQGIEDIEDIGGIEKWLDSNPVADMGPYSVQNNLENQLYVKMKEYRESHLKNNEIPYEYYLGNIIEIKEQIRYSHLSIPVDIQSLKSVSATAKQNMAIHRYATQCVRTFKDRERYDSARKELLSKITKKFNIL